MNYLFLCGCPRSGTTALWTLLSTSRSAAIGVERYGHKIQGQPWLTPDLFERERFFDVQPTDTFYANLSQQHKYYDKLSEYFDQTSVRGDKIPKLYRIYAEVLKNFPNGKIVYIFRNVFDVAASYEARATNANDMNWGRDSGFSVGVRDWNDSLQRTLQVYDPERICVISYEDLFYGNGPIDHLLEFCGIPMGESMSDALKRLRHRGKDIEAARPEMLTPLMRRGIIEQAAFGPFREMLKCYRQQNLGL